MTPNKGKGLASFGELSKAGEDMNRAFNQSSFLLYQNLPKSLRAYPNWLVWKYEERHGTKTAKAPYSPTTGQKGSNIELCGNYEQAIQSMLAYHYDGIGFQVSRTPYTVVDLDNCVDKESHTLNETAIDLFVMYFNQSYSEYSPSGTGIHIIIEGKAPNSFRNNKEGIEVYSENQFITVTGNRLQGADTEILLKQEEITQLYKLYKPSSGVPIDINIETPTIESIGSWKNSEYAEQINKALAHDNSGKFKSLFLKGDISLYGNDKSSADIALLRLLAYWFNGDTKAIATVFNYSPLARRNKWLKSPYYRRLSIGKALAHYLGTKTNLITTGGEDMACDYFSVKVDEINRGSIRILHNKYGMGVTYWLNGLRSVLATAFHWTDNNRPSLLLATDDDYAELAITINYDKKQAKGHTLKEFINDLVKQEILEPEGDHYFYLELDEYYKRRMGTKQRSVNANNEKARKREKRNKTVDFPAS